MSELLLGVDIGTSSSKGVLVQPNGDIIASAHRPHSLSLPQPGRAEQDADEVWWKDFSEICAELLPYAGGRVAAVCASGMGPCLLAANEQGRPLRPAILYGIDTRATREIAELTERYGAQRILARCGSLLTSQAIGPKLAWLRRNEPQVWERTRHMLMPSSYIVYRLTGEYVLDHHSASECDPLYDLYERQWILDWAEEIAPGLPLPRLLWPAEVAGVVTKAASEITGLLVGTPVVTGTTDAWAEAMSVGVRSPGDVMLMYGSTMFMIAILAEPKVHPRLWGTAGVFPAVYNFGAGMATSGALTDWLRKIACNLPYTTLIEESAAVAPGADGLVVLPYFAGERTPLYDARARGVICGLTLSHTRGHIYRALLESTAYGVRHILEMMSEAGVGGNRLVAVGGGTKGGLWMRIVSDVTGRRQEIPRETIGASYGDALMAAIAVGLAKPDAAWNPITSTVQPDMSTRQIYDSLYSIYRRLYAATRDCAHDLADIQNAEGEDV